MFKKIVISTLLVALTNLAVCPLSFAKEVPAGTIMNLKSLNEISSESSYAGSKVSFELNEDVLNSDGSVLLKAGSKVNGSISSIEPRSILSMSGKIGIQLNSISDNGKIIPVSNIINKKGNDKFDPDNDRFVIYVVASVVIWPYGLYNVLSKGKATVIPVNSIVNYKLDRAISL